MRETALILSLIMGVLASRLYATDSAGPLPDSVYAEAGISQVIVFGYAREDWIDNPEHNWFYSGVVLNVEDDTMLVATCLHSSGIYDMNRGVRLGSNPVDYNLYISFASGLLLPVQEMAIDTATKLMYLKLYIGDSLVDGYDYTTLESALDLCTGSNLYIAYFRPGQGRMREELRIVNRVSGAAQTDIWNFESEVILSEHRFDDNCNGSPVFFHDNTSDTYHLQGLLNLSKLDDRVDNVVFPVPSSSYIEDLTWKRVSAARVEEIRSIRLLPY